MSSNEESMEDINGHSFGKVKQRFKDRSQKTKEKTKQILTKQAAQIAKRAEEHERFINKVTHLMGVLGFGAFCFILGARPKDIRYVYCLFYVIFVPLRWIYYRYKKWHYYLLDFCYYANTIFIVTLLFFPTKEKLFMVCFSFAEGPLAWALIVWRCSLVFSSVDKIVSVFIHLLPGLVFFTIRWWDPEFFGAMHPEGTPERASWPYVESQSYLWTWLFWVPLAAYFLWQVLYYLIVDVLRRQRFLRDPEVMTSYRELSKKAKKANNVWWRVSSGVELILSQHGTRLQKELGEIMLKKYQHNPPVLQFVSKYFYSENVYDDDSTDKPKPRWRFRSTYGEIFSSHEVEGDDSSSKKSHSEKTDLRKTNLERKQINMNGVGAAVALESTEDPFDCILGHQVNTEEIHHPHASSPLPRRRSHSTRRSHSRRRMHRHENMEC